MIVKHKCNVEVYQLRCLSRETEQDEQFLASSKRNGKSTGASFTLDYLYTHAGLSWIKYCSSVHFHNWRSVCLQVSINPVSVLLCESVHAILARESAALPPAINPANNPLSLRYLAHERTSTISVTATFAAFLKPRANHSFFDQTAVGTESITFLPGYNGHHLWS